MPIRYIVRPKGIKTTPRALRDALDADSTKLVSSSRAFDPAQDFFLAYPKLSQLPEAHRDRLRPVREFYVSNKYVQRQLLADSGVPIPNTHGVAVTRSPVRGPFVVRPLRHAGGIGWRITHDQEDYIRGQEYLSEIFPKKWEYRVIYCKGNRVATLLKRIPAGLGQCDPWNHANGSSFVSVLDQDNDRLRRTTAYNDLSNNPVVKEADLVACDILMAEDRSYVVAEFNFCPSIKIDSTFRAIKETVNAHVQVPHNHGN